MEPESVFCRKADFNRADFVTGNTMGVNSSFWEGEQWETFLALGFPILQFIVPKGVYAAKGSKTFWLYNISYYKKWENSNFWWIVFSQKMQYNSNGYAKEGT